MLRERLPDLPTLAHPPAEGHNYLLDGLVDLALALAREQPLIIWCDDAQWADDATLAVLGRLARRAPRHALLVVLAYRSGELAENAALHDLLRALGREMLLRPILLGRLDDTEVAQILAGLARVAPARVAGLAPRLWASSGGNPLFLSVAVQSLLEARGARSLAALLPDLEAGAALPDLSSAPPLRDLVLSRVERLPGSARMLLEQLAVIGRPASLDLIEQLAGSAGLESARMLLERQFLAEEADGRLAFSHDLVRSIIVAALMSPQRRLLHRAAATAIAHLHGEKPERAAELAFHFEQSGHGAEEQLLHYAIAAGDHARRSFGYHAALAHYEIGLRAVDRMGVHAPADAARRAFAGSLLMYEALLDWDGIMNTAARYENWAVAAAWASADCDATPAGAAARLDGRPSRCGGAERRAGAPAARCHASAGRYALAHGDRASAGRAGRDGGWRMGDGDLPIPIPIPILGLLRSGAPAARHSGRRSAGRARCR